MIEMVTGLLVIASEFALLFALLFALGSYLVVRKWNSRRGQAKILVEKLKSGEAQRSAKRSRALRQNYGFADEVVEEIVARVLEKEKSLYARFIEIFLGRQQESLLQIDESIEALIDTCCSPLAKNGADQGAIDGGVMQGVLGETVKRLKDENHQLKDENERLASELRNLKSDTEQVLSEYVSMYNKGEKTAGVS